MSISFTGLSNIKVFKSEKQGPGMFQGANEEIKRGDINVTEVKLRFNLTNDIDGKDMEELQGVLKKAGKGYSYNPNMPDTVELHLKNILVDDGIAPISHSFLNMNNQNINIAKREDLGIYTYLAKLTKKIYKQPEISPIQKQYINLIRKAIKEKAVHYIDVIM